MNLTAANVADAWDKWAARFKNYFKAAELMKKEADVQDVILLELAILWPFTRHFSTTKVRTKAIMKQCYGTQILGVGLLST